MAFKIPNPKETGLFRNCNGCSICLKNIKEPYINFLEEGIKMILKHQDVIKKKINLKDDEYFFKCASNRINTCCNIGPWNYVLLSNYGKIIGIDLSYYNQQLGNIRLYNTYKMIDQHILNRIIKHKNIIYMVGKNPNNSDTWTYVKFNYELIDDILTEYCKEDKNEQHKLEKTKLEIQKMSKELQENESAYIKIKDEVDNKIQFITNEEKKLKDEKILHKEKVKNLMDRENKIYQKEKLKDIHQDLKDITISLYNYLDVLDLPNNKFETRISQIITSLNKFYQEDTIVIAENVNSDVVIAEPSAPLFL